MEHGRLHETHSSCWCCCCGSTLLLVDVEVLLLYPRVDVEVLLLRPSKAWS